MLLGSSYEISASNIAFERKCQVTQTALRKLRSLAGCFRPAEDDFGGRHGLRKSDPFRSSIRRVPNWIGKFHPEICG